MYREKERTLTRVLIELGLKTFTQLDDAFVRERCHTVFENWRRLIEDARAQDGDVSVMLWIGDGDEVFNWKGDMNEAFAWNDTVGFNNLNYNAYPENRHYRNGIARPYIENPPRPTYADLKRIIEILRQTAREMYGIEIKVGETIDAGPEFVQSTWKFEKHPELLKGGPDSEFPKSLSFLCCYANMKADDTKYATFPNGLPEGTPFGTFLGKQFESLAQAVGFDFVWFSNGFGLTHYAWNYLGEVYNGLERRPEKAPESIRQFVSFWKAFRAECPDRRILIRGTNFSIGMDATAHGIDIREIYREGKLNIHSPNPPWGSSNLGLEMAAHLSRISSTPTREILFRYYINDSWFSVTPWWDYYNRETFDIYCPMSAARLTSKGAAETPTDFNIMTANTGHGELFKTQSSEIEPHIRRAFDKAPDEAGPLVWVYPFSEYSDEPHRPDGKIEKSFFGDWYITRAIAGGLPLNTVINTDAFAECIKSNPETFSGRVLIVPTPAANWKYADAVLEYVKRGGQAIFYGSLRDASPELLAALNIRNDEPLEGKLEPLLKMEEDMFDVKPRRRPLIHGGNDSDGGITETFANVGDLSTQVRAIVRKEGKRRVYALVRQGRTWKGGKIGWIRGTLPFEVKPNSLEPVMMKADETHDAPTWLRYLLTDFGIDIRHHRRDISTPAPFFFVSRSRGSFFFNGHKPDVTPTSRLSFPDGAPILSERQAFVQKDRTTYHLDRSFHYECQAFVKQDKDSLIAYKENSTRPGQMRSFTITGLVDGVLTLYVPKEAIEKKKLGVKLVQVYSIQDPTSGDEAIKKLKKKSGPLEPELKWKVDPHTGGVVVEKVTGAVNVQY
jgi:hypothetical protein